jgi:hypothetical protein
MQTNYEPSSRPVPSPGLLAEQFLSSGEVCEAAAQGESPMIASQVEWKAKADDQEARNYWGRVTWARWLE